MKKQFLVLGIAVALLSTISSCVSLRAAHEFSSYSIEGITKFEDLNYGFTKHCMDRCVFELVRKTEISRSPECNCEEYKKADTATLLIYSAIRGYFEGLAQLSEDKLASYSLDPLKTALNEGSFGDIKINAEDVNAYAGISQILLNATTGAYRKKKVRKYIEESNPHMQILLQKFQFILQKNLEGELNFLKEKLFAYYSELLLNTFLNEYEKGRAASDYYQGLSDLETTQHQIDVFAVSLTDIAKGHQDIYNNRNKLTVRELKNSLVIYQSNIRDMIALFKKLKM